MPKSRLQRLAPSAFSALIALALALTAGTTTLAAQAAPVDLDTVRAGRFDMGRMWTFEYPPEQYFTETYGFNADDAWFDRIRLSVLRIPGCSASFVSPDGLVVTNHHCVRGRVAAVDRGDEHLLDNGFYATELGLERPIPGYYADRLLAVRDVSDEVFAALDQATTDEARMAARERVTQHIQQELEAEFEGQGDIRVQIIPLYNGGRHSAYVFRRFTDVRLVFAVELQAGFFGGDPDNFTYPRYALDFAFLRVYENGQPFHTDHWLAWGTDGVEEGDPVFIVGNPGRTSRLTTMAQLAFERDVRLPAIIGAYGERLDAMHAFYDAYPEEGDAIDIRNRAFGLSNSHKRYSGAWASLSDPVVMKKRQDIQDRFAAAIAADPELSSRYGDVTDRIAEVQELKRDLGPRYGAFLLLGGRGSSSGTMTRAVNTLIWMQAQEAGAPADTLDMLRQRATSVEELPPMLERSLLIARLHQFQRHLGNDDAITRQALQGMSPEDAADRMLASPLSSNDATARAMDNGALANDPVMALAATIWPAFQEFSMEYARLGGLEAELAADLGRARFAIYGTDIPPDGSSSPRIADGRVMSYAYNGTIAPPYTTMYGMYDHYYSYGPDTDWKLPPRFLPPPPELDLGTPLNFVSTADTYGGNSGSPAITPDHQIVGLNFDRNVEGLVRDYIYLPERGRNIMVDVRAIIEALDDLYDADRIVQEIVTGHAVASEAEASEDVRASR